MRIIDGHAHVIESIRGFGRKGELRPIGQGRVRMVDGTEWQMIPPGLGDRSFTGETLVQVLDANRVAKAVLLQGSTYGFQNEYSFEMARRHPDRLVAAGSLDPYCAEAELILESLLTRLDLKILKFELSSGAGLMSYHPPFPLIGGPLDGIWERLAAEDLTLVLDVGGPGMPSFQPAAVAAIARKYPSLRVVVCHLLAPGPGDAAALDEALATLACENVWFDLAAIPWNVAPEAYPYPTGLGFIRQACARVGHRKLIWGSDVPAVLTRESYQNLLNYILMAGVFKDAELPAIFETNAMAAYPCLR